MKISIRTIIEDENGRELLHCCHPVQLGVGRLEEHLYDAADHAFDAMARNYLWGALENLKDRS